MAPTPPQEPVARKAPHEYSTNQNTVRARKRKAGMDARTKVETQGVAADNKAVHREMQILGETESFKEMSPEQRAVKFQEVKKKRLEIRKKKGIDWESKLKRFDEEEAAKAAAEAADDGLSPDDGVGDVVGGSVDGDNNASIISGIDATDIDGFQMPGRFTPPDEDGYVEAELPLSEGGVPARPVPQLQDYLFQDQQAIPAMTSVGNNDPTPSGINGKVKAGQSQEAVGTVVMSASMLQELENRLQAKIQAEIQASVTGRLDAMQGTLDRISASFNSNADFSHGAGLPIDPAFFAHDQNYHGTVNGQVGGQVDGQGYRSAGFDSPGYDAQGHNDQDNDGQTSDNGDNSVYPPLEVSGPMPYFG